MSLLKKEIFKKKSDKETVSLILILVLAVALSMLPPSFKVITALVAVIICFITRKKSTAVVKNRVNRFNDFISLSDTEYRRLKFILDSDCKLTDLVCVKRQQPDSVSTADKSTAKPQASKPTPKSTNIKGDVKKWYDKNHEGVELKIAELSEQDIFTCQLQLLSKLPPKNCWQELCKKLADEWNVTCDICGNELHISWFQV